MDFEDYNADMEKYCQEAEDAVNEGTTTVDDSREKVYLDDYNAGLERYCREAAATAESIDITPTGETELFSKFYKQEELSEEAQNAKNKVIEANLDLAIALATKFALETVLSNLAAPIEKVIFCCFSGPYSLNCCF